MIKKNIPNFFTLCNLFCGCIAILFAVHGNLFWSALMVGLCCLFDFLDGMVARLLNVKSEIGKQLDSLADMVSFGVVPGITMYRLMLYSCVYSEPIESSKHADEFLFFPLIGFLVTIFSAIRLAKFNLDTRQSDSFIGLPTPANTIFIASLYPSLNQLYIQSIYYDAIKEIISSQFFLLSLTVISSLLLVAPLPLFAFKFKNFSWTDNKVRYIFLAPALALLIIFKFVGIPLIIVLYIILSIINNLLTKKSV